MSIAEQFHVPLIPAPWLKDVENILLAKFHRVNITPDEVQLTCWAFEVRPDKKLYLVGFRDGLYSSSEVFRFWVADHVSSFIIFTNHGCFQADRIHSLTAYLDSMKVINLYSKGAILSTRDVANVVLP